MVGGSRRRSSATIGTASARLKDRDGRPWTHDADVIGRGGRIRRAGEGLAGYSGAFSILGVAPARGRGTRAGDERAAIAVVSHELWRSRFGGADDILQRTIRLNGVDYAIVGVMPAGFGYPEPDMGAWLPIDLSPRGEVDRSDHFLGVVGRLAPAVSTAQARMDLQRIARDLQHDEPGAYPKDPQWSIDLESLRENQFGRMLLPLGVLMAAAASVLLIACVNVAIMSLLRALGRRREISIRFALGATRARTSSGNWSSRRRCFVRSARVEASSWRRRRSR